MVSKREMRELISAASLCDTMLKRSLFLRVNIVNGWTGFQILEALEQSGLTPSESCAGPDRNNLLHELSIIVVNHKEIMAGVNAWVAWALKDPGRPADAIWGVYSWFKKYLIEKHAKEVSDALQM